MRKNPRVDRHTQERRSLRRDLGGSAAIMMALGTSVIAGSAALGVDVGLVHMKQLELQRTADMAALAAAQRLPDDGAALAAAIATAGNNMPSASDGQVLTNSDVQFGVWDAEAKTFTVTDETPNAVRVNPKRAAANGNSFDLQFARILGFDEIDLDAEAIATLAGIELELALVLDVSGSMAQTLNDPTLPPDDNGTSFTVCSGAGSSGNGSPPSHSNAGGNGSSSSSSSSSSSTSVSVSSSGGNTTTTTTTTVNGVTTTTTTVNGVTTTTVNGLAGCSVGTWEPLASYETKIEALRRVTNTLITSLAEADPTETSVRVAVVPFSGRVNIARHGTSWMTSNGWSTADWLCTNQRTGGSDTNDDPPSIQLFPPFTMNGFACPDSQALGLTTNLSVLRDAVDDLEAYGSTNTDVGIVWGWRMLSDRWQGLWHEADRPASYDDKGVKKAMLIMSDGENTPHQTGDPYDTAEADNRVRQQCTDMKALGIEVFTVTFDAPSTIEDLYRECASSPDQWYSPATIADLEDAFADVGNILSKRIALVQ